MAIDCGSSASFKGQRRRGNREKLGRRSKKLSSAAIASLRCAFEASRRDNFRVVVANLSAGSFGSPRQAKFHLRYCERLPANQSRFEMSSVRAAAREASAARANVVEFRNFYKVKYAAAASQLRSLT